MTDIQSPTAEIRREKKEERRKKKIEITGQKYNGLPCESRVRTFAKQMQKSVHL